MIRSTQAVIDVDALEWNLSQIRGRSVGAKVMAMVKANAYGHGMVPIARVLEHLNVDMLGVAFVSEAVELRAAGIRTPIVVLTKNEAAESELVVELGLTTVACNIDQIGLLSEAAQKKGRVVDMHLFVDTGMRRDGIYANDVNSVLERTDAMPGVRITGILTHFATADVPNDPFIAEQHDIFDRVLRDCLVRGRTFEFIHAANTGAIWQAPYSIHTVVRPGLSLHGYASPSSGESVLRQTMSLRTKVLGTRLLAPGDTVSYGRRFTAVDKTRIATLPIGYGDGYLRALTGKAKCLIGGNEYPIVGVICMDECMVDIGDADIGVGDDVVLLGPQKDEHGALRSIDATQLAEWAGTIPYEITTAVSARVPRIYIGALASVAMGNT